MSRGPTFEIAAYWARDDFKDSEMRFAMILLGVLAFTLPGAPAAHAQTGPPNIVLILADDLGYGDLGCYGQKQIATPNLDHLAAAGMRFTQFYAGSTVCAPSRCVLMTGLHTGHARIRGNANVDLRPEDRTIAEVLHKAGYATGLFGKWGLGGEGSAGVPTRKGFDEFFGYLDQHHAHNYWPAFLFFNESRIPLANQVPPARGTPFGTGVATLKCEYSPDLLIEHALRFVDAHKDRPFFLEFASTLPHANNEAKPNGLEIPDYGIYRDKNWPATEKGVAAMISRLDADVGRLMTKLRERHLEENTVVFFTSDNGPHKEGGRDPRFLHSSGPLRGFKRDLYEGGIRVPMIVRWPGRVPAGSVSDHIGYFGDLFQTACDLAGIPVLEELPIPSKRFSPERTASVPYSAPPHPHLDSISIVPTLMGTPKEPQRDHEYLYWEFYEKGSAQGVRMGKWKGVIRPLGSNHVELYDLASDLGETTDLAAEHPEVVQRLLAAAREAHVPSPLWKVLAAPRKRPRRTNREGARNDGIPAR